VTKTVLVVAAHPDDETLGCGATLAKHAVCGDTVYVIFMADGVGSRLFNSPEDEAYRSSAAESACAILGVHSIDHFGFKDNRLDSYDLLDLVQRLESKLAIINPDIIYTHNASDLNVDHRLTYQTVMTACRPLPGSNLRAILSFEVPSSTEWSPSHLPPFKPNYFVDIGGYLERKLDALNEYQLEMRAFPHARSLEAIEYLARYRGASVGMTSAESFFVERMFG